MPIPTPIRFRRNEFQSFIATRTFAVPGFPSGIPRGAEILFDGAMADYAGVQVGCPQLLGAIKAGWLVAAEAYDEAAVEAPRPAGIQVRHATEGGNPMRPGQGRTIMTTTESDEREVNSNIRTRAKETSQRNAAPRNIRPKAASAPLPRGVEPQDGVEVRPLKTLSGEKSKHAVTTLTGNNTMAAVAEVTKGSVIEPGRGVTEEEMLARMTEEEQALYLAEKESRKAQYVDLEAAPVPVRQIRTASQQSQDGIRSTVSVGGGTAAVDLSGVNGKASEATVTYEDGIKMTNTNGPRQGVQPARPAPAVVVKPANEDARRRVAKRVCPDFPDNYDFSLPPKKKMARLMADYSDRPDVIQAVYAAESDEMKSLLEEEFPEALGLELLRYRGESPCPAPRRALTARP